MKKILSKEELIGTKDNRPNEYWEIVHYLYNADSETDIEERCGDTDSIYTYYLEQYIKENKIVLSGEQAKRFIEEFKSGDIWGLRELQKILKEELEIKDTDTQFTIYDLLANVINMNTMLVWGCEDTNGLVEYFTEIRDLYDKLLDKLFNSFANDFSIYWE